MAILRGLLDDQTPRPFIDVFWHQGRIIDIAIRELFEVAPAERAQRNALLSAGLDLLNTQRDETKIKKLIAAIMTATIKKQWGGPRRKPKDFDPATCERFARKVNELEPLWNTITDFFEREEYDSNCVAMVQKHSGFEQHSAVCTSKVPLSLLKQVFKRKNERGERYWPSSFAILHAMRELNITGKYAISTLHKFHRKGNRRLKQRGPSVST